MLKSGIVFRSVARFSFIVLLAAPCLGEDWPEWRGPARDGRSTEIGLPSSWSVMGEHLLWKAPYGGRSGPIVVGNHVYLQDSAGQGADLQERVLCIDTDTGKLVWEYRFNVYLSDVPPHRVGWSSPVGDPISGNVYALGVGGVFLGLSRDGKLIWERSLAEEFGLVTTHGGRTVSPVIEGDLIIVSGITTGWGNQAKATHRFLAFDKNTGETVWVSSPGGRPFDTTYAPPIAALINGTRLLIAGGSDGSVHSLKPQTGQPVWKYEMSKRGINTGAVLKDNWAIVSHSEENFDSVEMGLLAAIDASAKGTVGKDQIKWTVKGFQGGYSSPVIDGDRIYQIDNGANLYAFDFATGKQLWIQNLGTIQKSSPVFADGKLYVGTENGKFFILKPGEKGCDVLDADLLGTEESPEAILGSVAISNGRIYLASSNALYCIGMTPKRGGKTKKADSTTAVERNQSTQVAPSNATAALVQVVPTELVLKPGENVKLRARLFDEQGRFIKESDASWSLEQLKGDMKSDGTFIAASDNLSQAGQVKATINQLSGVARVRVIAPLPWNESFDSITGKMPPPHWINATGKFEVRDVEGNKVLVKLADNPFTKRARAYLGPVDWHDYTVEADIKATEKRRQMGDAGIVAQRYELVLFGNSQKLELQSWQPETARTVSVPFSWKADTWYRMKLRVENLPDGKIRALGRVWPAQEMEPSSWSIEKVDSFPNRKGSPGIYADAPFEIFFDNLKVTSN